MKLLKTALAAGALLFAGKAALAGEAPAGRVTDFTLTAINGTPLPLSAFEGRVLLVVNTASFCGFTRQYEGLQALWERYQDRGLVVLGVPSNDFSQEPKSEGEIAEFCRGAFGVTFPLSEKMRVTGTEAHPLYRWIATAVRGGPGWNFHKYLIERDGRTVTSFPTNVPPSSTDLVAAIERALDRPAPEARLN